MKKSNELHIALGIMTDRQIDEFEKEIKKENKNTKTNHIIIEIDDNEKAQEVFDEIQNKYEAWDNCVLDSNVSKEDSIKD